MERKTEGGELVEEVRELRKVMVEMVLVLRRTVRGMERREEADREHVGEEVRNAEREGVREERGEEGERREKEERRGREEVRKAEESRGEGKGRRQRGEGRQERGEGKEAEWKKKEERRM